MSATDAGKAGSAESDKALFATLVLAIVLLLIVTNAQLWRLGGDQGEGGRVAANELSTLPPPVPGTSNEVLTRQLRGLSGRISGPLDGLSSQLAGLAGLGGAQSDVAGQLGRIGSSLNGLGGLRGEVGQMTAGLGRMVDNTDGMSRGLDALGTQMSATRMSMGGLTRIMRQVEGGIQGTNAASGEASAGIAALGATMAAMSEGLAEANAANREAGEGIAAMRDATTSMASTIAATADTSREMRDSLEALNERMGNLLELFCMTLGLKEPPCGGAEAAGANAGGDTAVESPRPEENALGGLRPAERP